MIGWKKTPLSIGDTDRLIHGWTFPLSDKLVVMGGMVTNLQPCFFDRLSKLFGGLDFVNSFVRTKTPSGVRGHMVGDMVEMIWEFFMLEGPSCRDASKRKTQPEKSSLEN